MIFLEAKKSTNVMNLGLLNMLDLYSHWVGHGTAIFYPKLMKILSKQLNNQSGFMSTYSHIPAGKNWQMIYDLTMTCKQYNDNTGVGLWLTQNKPMISEQDYTYEMGQRLYGMTTAINGLMILYKHNTLRVGITRTPELTQGEILYTSKICKINRDKNDMIRIQIKFFEGQHLGVYVLGTTHKNETLCVQFDNVPQFSQFYPTIAGADKNGHCSSTVNNLSLYSDQKFEVVEKNQKKAGDPFFCALPNTVEDFDKSIYSLMLKKLELKRLGNKILANELLKFADVNQKEFKETMNNNLNKYLGEFDQALEIVENEAKEMQIFGSFIEQQKKINISGVKTIFDVTIDYLDKINASYDKVEESTSKIYQMINELDFASNLMIMAGKSERIAIKLNEVLFKSKKFKLKPIEYLKKKKMNVLKKWMNKIYQGNLTKSAKKNKTILKKKAKQKILTLRNQRDVVAS